MVQSNHLMFFVMGWGGCGVSCDLFGHHKKLGGGESLVSDFLCQLELTSLVCLTLSLCRSLRGGKERKMRSWPLYQLESMRQCGGYVGGRCRQAGGAPVENLL